MTFAVGVNLDLLTAEDRRFLRSASNDGPLKTTPSPRDGARLQSLGLVLSSGTGAT